jgi:hypothetical protein
MHLPTPENAILKASHPTNNYLAAKVGGGDASLHEITPTNWAGGYCNYPW